MGKGYTMEKTQTLVSMFEANKEVLENELTGLVLPKDVNKIQNTIASFLNKLLDSEGEFRQKLTKSEDYILGAALSLLKNQQDIACKLSESEIEFERPLAVKPKGKTTENDKAEESIIDQPIKSGQAIVASGVGSAIGAVAFSTSWGIVFSSLATTAILIYWATKHNKREDKVNTPQRTVELSIKNINIDVSAFINIIAQMCDNIDCLIETFRSQIQKVVDNYESKEKPTLEKDYEILLESIQSLLGIAYRELPDDKRLQLLDIRIENLANSLINYGLKVEQFSEDNMNLFEQIESSKVLEKPEMVCPAICKNGILVKYGKVFVNK